MTIAGLTVHVEAVLTALLAYHHVVKSWTVAGEGQDTVCVLRLNSSQQLDLDQGAAITVITIGNWRKKSAAQVRRDRTRAEDRQGQRQMGVCDDIFDPESNASVKRVGSRTNKQNSKAKRVKSKHIDQ